MLQEINGRLKPLLDYVMEKRCFDFSGYRPSILVNRIEKRRIALNCKTFDEYLSYVETDTHEIDRLIDVITINVSRFFRDTLVFELLADRILPAIVHEKIRNQDHSLRIWSSGCARGEEPYSIAILLNELFRKEKLKIDLHIFATDIDATVLERARKAVYPLSSVKNTKYRLLMKYFTVTGDDFELIPEIKDQVIFSSYDMLDKKHYVPPESIFGNFDLVLCRNLLIYFNARYQEIIFTKLHQALSQNGYLVLGEAEAPPIAYQNYFNQVLDIAQIFRKRTGKIRI